MTERLKIGTKDKLKRKFYWSFWRIIMYIKENSPVKDSNMNYQEQKYYQQGKIDGIREFARELKNHSCSYDLIFFSDKMFLTCFPKSVNSFFLTFATQITSIYNKYV